MPNIVELIQQIAQKTNNASALSDVLFGTVISISPLKISVEQKLELSEEFLILTKNVKDYTVDVSMEWNTETRSLNVNHNHAISGEISINSSASINPNPDNVSISINNDVNSSLAIDEQSLDLSHAHNITGKKTLTIHNALKNGDKVILIQQQGGQKFIVLDKV